MKSKIEFTDKELHLIQSACDCLWDSLDITNSELKYRDTDVSKSIYEQNIKDMKILDRIINKIRKIDNGKDYEII